MSESECRQIIIEVPPEIELSEDELAKLVEKFRSDIIEMRNNSIDLQTKMKQIQARVRRK